MRNTIVVVVGVCLLLAAGCAKKTTLMPTPSIYLNSAADPFAEVPAELRSNRVEVLYITDRTREDTKDGKVNYGHGRSRSLAVGKGTVCLGGEDGTWEQLAEASRASKRKGKFFVSLVEAEELIRFPETPPTLVAPPKGAPAIPHGWEEAWDASAQQFREEIASALAKTPTKEVFIYVHGVANSFEGSVKMGGQFWHFLGRRGVPIVYTWPSGAKGLKAYAYDRESGEFTIHHFKQFLRLLASCPQVERINIVCHSRGTDVTASAIRELHLELHGAKQDSQKALKLGTLVMAAPDMDMEVVLQRLAAERVGLAVNNTVIYISAGDRAIGLANWLFGGVARMGAVRSDFFTPQERQSLRDNPKIQVIDVQVKKLGSFGHSYFYANPAVSSDLILVLRGQPPGPDHGRPLGTHENGFWVINDDYRAAAR